MRRCGEEGFREEVVRCQVFMVGGEIFVDFGFKINRKRKEKPNNK